MKELVISLIFAIAPLEGVPPNFALAIALVENPTLDPTIISGRNRNGSVDRGVMQLNSVYFSNINWSCAETNIRTAVRHIKYLMDLPEVNTYWAVAIAYNAGVGRLKNPPVATVDYAGEVMRIYTELSGGYVNPVISDGGR